MKKTTQIHRHNAFSFAGKQAVSVQKGVIFFGIQGGTIFHLGNPQSIRVANDCNAKMVK